MAQPAYDFSLFDVYDYGTAAPARKPEYQPEEPISFPFEEKKQSTAKNTYSNKANNSAVASALRIAGVLAVVVFVFSFIFAAMSLNSTLDKKVKMIASIEKEISVAQSENVRLNSELEGMISFDKLKDYAENTLGMVLLEDYKITFFESNEENEVVLSGGKSYDSGIFG
ncbi:MAG: hypothetical protein IJZ35_05160 [Clostridia bacterium]|nr:hypothetical protein [Clostridia bacterium]